MKRIFRFLKYLKKTSKAPKVFMKNQRYESIRKACAIYQGTNTTATESDIPYYCILNVRDSRS